MFHSIQVQNSTWSPFSNVDLEWKNVFRHGAQNKVAIEVAYIPRGKYHIFWRVNEGICKPHLSGTNIKTWPSKKRLRSQQSKITLVILGIRDNSYESFFLFFIFI